MVKNLLIKSCDIIGREDLSEEIKNANSVDEIVKNDIKSDIFKLFSYLNYTISSIFEYYLSIDYTEKLSSNSYAQIEFFTFSYIPTKIKKVENEHYGAVNFEIKPNLLIVDTPHQNYYVTYSFVPPKIHDFYDKLMLPKSFNEKIICYGIASEFLASMGKFNESEFYSNKFLFEIFKQKTRKESRLKPTFKLW